MTWEKCLKFIYLFVGTFATCSKKLKSHFTRKQQWTSLDEGKLMFEHQTNRLLLTSLYPHSFLPVLTQLCPFLECTRSRTKFFSAMKKKNSQRRTRSGISEIENSSFVWRNKTFSLSMENSNRKKIFSLETSDGLDFTLDQDFDRREENQT